MEKSVTAREARELQEQGSMVLDKHGKKCFSADYMILYRPYGINYTDPDKDLCIATKLN